MKNSLKILFLSLLLILLVGCSNSGKAADIINNDGKKEKLTAEELYNINKENNEKFKKYYVGASISFDGTVKSVVSQSLNCYGFTSYERDKSGLKSTTASSVYDKNKCVVINFEEDFMLLIPSNSIIDIADVNKGDKYHVESNIIHMYNSFVECFGIDKNSKNKSVDFNLTKISKIK